MDLFNELFSWGTTASFDNATIKTWAAGLVLVLIIAFLWSTVVSSIIRKAGEIAE